MTKQKILAEFNRVAAAWLKELEATSQENLLIKPSEREWCLAELYDHVMRVARTYQIPNFNLSLSPEALRKKRKNIYGLVIFNVGLRKFNTKIRMQDFPAPLVKDFTPITRDKAELIADFEQFIEEVNSLEKILLSCEDRNKHYHPMFGDIKAKDWFALIAVHMIHHEKQKRRINDFVAS
jgi:hypothetical protein